MPRTHTPRSQSMSRRYTRRHPQATSTIQTTRPQTTQLNGPTESSQDQTSTNLATTLTLATPFGPRTSMPTESRLRLSSWSPLRDLRSQLPCWRWTWPQLSRTSWRTTCPSGSTRETSTLTWTTSSPPSQCLRLASVCSRDAHTPPKWPSMRTWLPWLCTASNSPGPQRWSPHALRCLSVQAENFHTEPCSPLSNLCTEQLALKNDMRPTTDW